MKRVSKFIVTLPIRREPGNPFPSAQQLKEYTSIESLVAAYISIEPMAEFIKNSKGSNIPFEYKGGSYTVRMETRLVPEDFGPETTKAALSLIDALGAHVLALGKMVHAKEPGADVEQPVVDTKRAVLLAITEVQGALALAKDPPPVLCTTTVEQRAPGPDMAFRTWLARLAMRVSLGAGSTYINADLYDLAVNFGK
jgi:hypothetical protein